MAAEEILFAEGALVISRLMSLPGDQISQWFPQLDVMWTPFPNSGSAFGRLGCG